MRLPLGLGGAGQTPRFLNKLSDRLTARGETGESLAATEQNSDRSFRKGPVAALRPTSAPHTEHIAR